MPSAYCDGSCTIDPQHILSLSFKDNQGHNQKAVVMSRIVEDRPWWRHLLSAWMLTSTGKPLPLQSHVTSQYTPTHQHQHRHRYRHTHPLQAYLLQYMEMQKYRGKTSWDYWVPWSKSSSQCGLHQACLGLQDVCLAVVPLCPALHPGDSRSVVMVLADRVAGQIDQAQRLELTQVHDRFQLLDDIIPCSHGTIRQV